MSEDRRAYMREYKRQWRLRRRGEIALDSRYVRQQPPSPEALAERDRTLAQTPHSIVALIAGDPLPGRSALDRRR